MTPLLLTLALSCSVIDVWFDGDHDGWSADEDCDDEDPSVHPGAREIVADGIDQDCDGHESCYVDSDRDRYGTSALVASDDLDCTGTGESEVSSDCNDGNPKVHPGADEHCDGIDEDCDVRVDEEAVDAVVRYPDADGDGYGDPDRGLLACEHSASYLDDASDCDDGESAVNPGADEICDDIDNNCDGLTDDAEDGVYCDGCPLGWGGDDCNVCDVGYSGVDCDECVPPYTKSMGECVYFPTCASDAGWMVEGAIAPDSHNGPSSFTGAGTSTEPTVIDRYSGLEWRICTVGKTWSGGTCAGRSVETYWAASLSLCDGAWGGAEDWRVASIDELDSLIDFTAEDPAVDSDSFPGFPRSGEETALWPSTSELPDGSRGVLVYLGQHGHRWADSLYYTLPVLCVRGGSSRTDRRFSVVGTSGEMIQDDYTGLIWERCPLGSSWEKGTCSDTATTLTWVDAQEACEARDHEGATCRLPTVRELRLIKDHCLYPLLDTAAFPDIAEDFWTSTPYVGSPESHAWMVRMGGAVYTQRRLQSDAYSVRCVCEP